MTTWGPADDGVWSGRRYGTYQLDRQLGKGAVATVHTAYRHDGELVALKILTPFAEANPEVLRLFDGEYRLGSRLDHPNIVKVNRTGDVAGSHFLEMEYVDGQTLGDRIHPDHRLPEAEVLNIGRQMAAALQHCHDHRVVHRDVKPANVLAAQDGRVLLFDFGLALDMDGEEEPAGRVYGSPMWLSPEQARSARVDGRADLYGLGATLYRLAAGRSPFYGDRSDLIRAHVEDEPPPLDEVSPSLGAVILKAMAKDPADRYQAGDEMAEALAGVEPAAPPPPRRRFRDRFRRP